MKMFACLAACVLACALGASANGPIFLNADAGVTAVLDPALGQDIFTNLSDA